MLKYDNETFEVDKLKENNIDRIQLGMVPENSNVLEIGCATGYMSEYLIQKMGCKVTGIEIDPHHAETAKDKCHRFILGGIDDYSVQQQLDLLVLEQGRFDVVFMSQVIEHIASPENVLVKIQDWLDPKGCLVISTCNIAHWKYRLKLLFGKWEYEKYGILDETHLRFFTTHSFRKVLENCGYRVVDEGYSFEDFCPFRLLFDKRVLAPSDLLRLIPFIGMTLRKKYIYRFRNIISTQFAYKGIPVYS